MQTKGSGSDPCLEDFDDPGEGGMSMAVGGGGGRGGEGGVCKKMNLT